MSLEHNVDVSLAVTGQICRWLMSDRSESKRLRKILDKNKINCSDPLTWEILKAAVWHFMDASNWLQEEHYHYFNYSLGTALDAYKFGTTEKWIMRYYGKLRTSEFY